jgi:hypothetical protein
LCGFFKRTIVLEVHLFGFQGLEEALCHGVVIWAPCTTHADLDSVCFEDLDIVVRGILATAIRVMHQRRYP